MGDCTPGLLLPLIWKQLAAVPPPFSKRPCFGEDFTGPRRQGYSTSALGSESSLIEWGPELLPLSEAEHADGEEGSGLPVFLLWDAYHWRGGYLYPGPHLSLPATPLHPPPLPPPNPSPHKEQRDWDAVMATGNTNTLLSAAPNRDNKAGILSAAHGAA